MNRRLKRTSLPALLLLLGLIGLGPVVLLAYFSITLAADAVKDEAVERVSGIAAGRADAVATELEALVDVVEAYGRRKRLAEALEAPTDPAELRRQLRELQSARHGVAIAFVTDLDARLIDIVPRTPAIEGEDFSFRDWYQGLVRTGRTYVSEAYVTQARNGERVVAASTYVRGSAGGGTVAVLVAAYRLEHVQEFVDRFEAEEGVRVSVTDQRGTVLARPQGAVGLVRAGDDPGVAAALRGGRSVLFRDGPDGPEIAAFVPVPTWGWTVSAVVSERAAFARVDSLVSAVLTIAGTLSLLILAGVSLLGRALLLRQRAERRILAQNEELEAARTELEAQNDELEAQQGELERALEELAAEKERVQGLYEFGRATTAESELEPLCWTILAAAGDVFEAEIGIIYVIGESGALRPVVSRGREASSLKDVRPNEGLAGRALAELRTVSVSHGETGLEVPAFGEQVAVRHELHVPLVQAGRPVGVLSLARLADRPFSSDEIGLLEVLADHAGVALSNVLAYLATQRLATVNQAVLDATVDAIRLIDREGNTLVENAAMVRLAHDVLQLPVEGELYERLDALADRTTDPAAYRARIAQIQMDPELEATDDYELLSGHCLQRYTAPVRDASGALIGRIFVLRDVTASREAERLKSELVATVSHELRTPLASILGFSELLVQRDIEGGTRERYLATIHAEARRLTALINDFLDLQRIEQGRFTLALESFDLGGVLRHEVELFSGQSSAHTLELDALDGELPVLGERDRITQVVSNLISNAIKYSPAGGSVGVRAAASNGAVRVSVEDRGLGIPADQQADIFTKFFRVDTSDTREIGGTGLGLALAKEVVEAHGGRIGFESVEGGGSTFWFELPSGERGEAGGSRRVLVVEDDPAAAALLADYLAEDGSSVTIAATGEDALLRAEADPPDLVCLDIRLAGALDGWQVLERLKAVPATAGVPVIVCTGNNGRQRAAALGAADFLTKPFSAARLRETIARVLPEGAGTVLVVDDELSVRRLVVDLLGGEGLALREAADGEEALRMIAEERPDAVVLDLLMPVLDGFGVLERLASDPDLRDIPVIVLTGVRLSSAERARLSRQAVPLLEKSVYSAGDLRRLVRQALGRHVA